MGRSDISEPDPDERTEPEDRTEPDWSRPSVLRKVDEICDAFEQALIAGREPVVDDFLGETPEPDRSRLRSELEAVAQEYGAAARGGSSKTEEQALGPTAGMPSETGANNTQPSDPQLPTPVRIGRYRIHGVLGEGAFGRVYEGFDEALNRNVAIKVVPTWSVSGQDTPSPIEEARALAQLDHPAIVPVYDVGLTDDGGLYIVSKEIDGTDLKERMQRGRVDRRAAVRLVLIIADGLQHAHERGVTHRDVKPSNILIDSDEQPWLTDFGLALNEPDAHRGRQVTGTPGYMSPEQARGDSGLVDGRSDLFSLGVVMYELLTGRRPFAGETCDEILEHINRLDARPPRQFDRTIPADLERICLKAIAREPQDRFACAADLAAELRRSLDSSHGSASTSPSADPPATRRRVSQWLLWSAAIAACLALAIAVFGPRGSNNNTDQSHSTPPPAASATGDVRETIAQTVMLATEPAGAEVHFIPLDPQTGQPQPDRKTVGPDTNPVTVKLLPGDYLVVAIVPGYGFHEVYRRVPGPGFGMSGALRHQFSKIHLDGTVELTEIHIPPDSVTDGMAYVEGDAEFVVGSSELEYAPPHLRRIPDFHLDVTEITVARYRKARGALPKGVRDSPPPDNYPITGVSYDLAVSFAEHIGKRLPDEAEYELAATRQGAVRYPWGDAPTPVAEWTIGPVGDFAYDRTATEPPIVGLFSNAGEWTSSWGTVYPNFIGLTNSPVGTEERIVRGIPARVLEGDDHRDPAVFNPRSRVLLIRSTPNDLIGFRCARSAAPRTRVEDFVTIIER